MGCFGLSIPERYGGIQSDDHEDNMGMIVVTEELSRGSLGGAGSLITRPEILSRSLLKGGTEEQRTKWLPQVAMGDPLCAVAVTEPDAGSDVAAMRLKATKCDGGWILDGAKTWCTMAGKAGVLLVLARSNPDSSLGHRGLSMFLVEKDSYEGHDFEYRQPQGGVITGRAIATIGYRGMHSYEVFFDQVFVPDENLVGGPQGEGKGFYFTMAGFAGGRIQTAARAIGVMQAAFEKAVSYAQERKAFGKPIGEFQLTRVKLARMATLLTVSRQFTYAVGRLMDRGQGQIVAADHGERKERIDQFFGRDQPRRHDQLRVAMGDVGRELEEGGHFIGVVRLAGGDRGLDAGPADGAHKLGGTDGLHQGEASRQRYLRDGERAER